MARLAAALVAALALAAPAHASWSQPVDVSLPGWDASAPHVAVGPSGHATAVWYRFDGTAEVVQARRIGPNGELGPILDLSDPGEGAFDPRVAVDASGAATVAWVRWDGSSFVVQARRIDAAGNRGPVEDLSDPDDDAESPRLAVDAAGNATVVWTANNTAQARRFDASGALGPIRDLSALGFQPDVAVDPSGNAVAVWRHSDAVDNVVEARLIEPDGDLAPVVPLSEADEDSFDARVAVGPTGIPVVTWWRIDGVVQSRRGLAAPGPVEDLSDPGEIATIPQIAADPAGNATIVWQGLVGADRFVRSRRIAADGTIEETRDVAETGEFDNPQVAVDGAGEATAVWEATVAPARGVQARAVAADGVLGETVDLSPFGSGDEAEAPQVAAGPGAAPAAVWMRWDGSDWRIVASRFVVPAPPPPPPPPPADTSPVLPSPPAPGCAQVALRRLASYTRGQPKRRRAKGVGVRLVLSGPGRLDLTSATLAYRLRGKRRTARLRTRDLDAGGAATLRFKLPRALARRLPLGRRATLRLRARAGAPGCGFGAARTLSARTRLIWVPRSAR